MIKTVEELRVKLEDKTERTAIEAILNEATIPVMKGYMKEEVFDCTGYHTWKKADFVETIAVGLMEDIAREHADDEDIEMRYDELTEGATMAEKVAEVIKTAECSHADEAYSNAPGDNSHPEDDIPEMHLTEESPEPDRASAPEKNFLPPEDIIQKGEVITTVEDTTKLLKEYEENREMMHAMIDGIRMCRRWIEVRRKQGLMSEGLLNGIEVAKAEYRKSRMENFQLRRKLLEVRRRAKQ